MTGNDITERMDAVTTKLNDLLKAEGDASGSDVTTVDPPWIVRANASKSDVEANEQLALEVEELKERVAKVLKEMKIYVRHF